MCVCGREYCQSGLRDGDGGRVWGRVGGGLRPLPCHHIPRHPSKVTHSVAAAFCSHITMFIIGPCGHSHAHINTYISSFILTFSPSAPLLLFPTGQFITGPAWLRREVRSQLYNHSPVALANTANAWLHICWVIYIKQKFTSKDKRR